MLIVLVLITYVYYLLYGLLFLDVERTSDILQKVQLNFYDKPVCDDVFEGDYLLRNGLNEDSQVIIILYIIYIYIYILSF